MTEKCNIEVEMYYEKYHKAIFHTAHYILKDVVASEDAMQETFLKFISNYEKGIDHVGAWLITCTRNYCFNYLRDKKETTNLDRISVSTSSPEKAVEQKIFFDEILSNLESDVKEIFMLHILCNLKHKDIAIILSLPQSTVRWKYSNAVKTLKSIIK